VGGLGSAARELQPDCSGHASSRPCVRMESDRHHSSQVLARVECRRRSSGMWFAPRTRCLFSRVIPSSPEHLGSAMLLLL
jgi:hypothetical protein